MQAIEEKSAITFSCDKIINLSAYRLIIFRPKDY